MSYSEKQDYDFSHEENKNNEDTFYLDNNQNNNNNIPKKIELYNIINSYFIV